MGEKIKIDNSVIYIKETAYIIDHDYLGYAIKEPIIITSTDDIIHITFNHVVFSKDVLYYRDKQNKVYVYGDTNRAIYFFEKTILEIINNLQNDSIRFKRPIEF